LTTNPHQELAPSESDTSLSDEVVASSSGDENEAPAGRYQTAADANVDVQYAKASVRYKAAKAEYELARRELVAVVQQSGDKEGLLNQRLSLPIYEMPLPMSFAEIKAYMGWDNRKANSWLKYRVKKGTIKYRGSRGHYVYFYPSDPSGEQYGLSRNQ